MDRFQGMVVFARVVETSSFSKAAERLDMSTTAVSRYVAELERHLGARLLHRSTRRLSLTDMGRAYYERCVQILGDVEEAEAVAGAATVKPSGVLKISIPVTFGIRHLAPILPQYSARYPEVSLDVMVSDRAVDLVEEGFDLAVRITRDLKTTMVVRPIAPAQFVVCASPAYLQRHGTPRVPEDLTEHNCLTYTYMANRNEWPFEGKDGTHVVAVKGTMQANSGDMVLAAALAGMGIILQPTFIVGEDVKAGRLQQVLANYPLPPTTVYAVYSSRRHLSAKVRTFVDFLIECFGEKPHWDQLA